MVDASVKFDIATAGIRSINSFNTFFHVSNHSVKGSIAGQQNGSEFFHESMGLNLCFVFRLGTIMEFCKISHKKYAPALGTCIGFRPDESIRTGLARRLVLNYMFVFFDYIANTGNHETVFTVMDDSCDVRIAHVDVSAENVAPVSVFPF